MSLVGCVSRPLGTMPLVVSVRSSVILWDPPSSPYLIEVPCELDGRCFGFYMKQDCFDRWYCKISPTDTGRPKLVKRNSIAPAGCSSSRACGVVVHFPSAQISEFVSNNNENRCIVCTALKELNVYQQVLQGYLRASKGNR